MKKISLFLAMFTVLAAVAAPFTACNNPDKISVDDGKLSPSASLVPAPTKQPLGTLTPILLVDLTKRLNENGIPVCKKTIFNLGFQSNLRSPVYHVCTNTDDFSGVINPIFGFLGSNEFLNDFSELLTDEHFENYFVVTLNVPFGTGSNELVFDTAKTDNGITKLYFSVHSSGDVGTAVMTSAFAAISLDRITFNAENPVEVYIGNALVNTTNGEIK